MTECYKYNVLKKENTLTSLCLASVSPKLLIANFMHLSTECYFILLLQICKYVLHNFDNMQLFLQNLFTALNPQNPKYIIGKRQGRNLFL